MRLMSDHDIESETRRIFHEIHVQQPGTDTVATRIRGLVSTESLEVEPDYFHGKLCGDLGSGSAALGTCNLLDLGCKFVHALDLDQSFVDTASRELGANFAYNGRWQADIGSLTQLPYDDGYFDFVLCQGVIHHIEDDAKAISEIARVLRNGGHANLVVHGSGGLITRVGMEIMRKEYADNDKFRALVDSELSPEWIEENINWLIERVDNDGSDSYRKCICLLECLRDLLDGDFILTLQDRMQAPLYKMYSEAEFVGMLREAGFSSWRRITRKPIFGNIRKILTPLYDEYDSNLARLFYGEGMQNFLVTK